MLEFDGVTVAMVHRFPTPKRRSSDVISAYTERTFPGAEPDVVIYGHTHRNEIHVVDDLLCVNPGSPTLPRNLSLQLGTIAILEVSSGDAHAHLLQLTDAGAVPFTDPH